MSHPFNTRLFLSLGILTLSVVGSPGADTAGKPETPSVEAPEELGIANDPRATYRAYLAAIRKGDLDAALTFWHYPETQDAEMRVAVGIWTAHRRLDRAVAEKFGAEADLSSLEGFIDERTTDAALDLADKMLAAAVIKMDGDSAKMQLSPDESHEGHDHASGEHHDHNHGPVHFDFPEDASFLKVNGLWKFTAKPPEGDFFAKGSWGPAFQGMVALLSEAADKVLTDELKTIPVLKEFLDGKLEAITKQYGLDQIETSSSINPTPEEHEENGD